MYKLIKHAGIGLLLGSMATTAAAQSAAEDLGEITVTSPRVEKPITKVPASISLVDQGDIQRGQRQLTLDESLNRVPGVFLQNRENFSQAQRISIRGFGARSPFGIRGIRLVADGIPLTLPDGSGTIDEIDLASAERIEVIRGPASSLYGPASGGVINIVTEDGPAEPYVEGRYTAGAFGLQRHQLKAGGQYKRLNYVVSASNTELDGFRDNSFMTKRLFNTKLRYDIDATSDITAVFNVGEIPKMGDPGSLTAAQVAANREQANPRALVFDGSEERSQQRMGFVYRKNFGEKHEIRLRNYYTWLDFSNKLPFPGGVAGSNGGQVQFDRFFVGGGGQYIYTDTLFGHANRVTVGFDIDYQQDDRQRFVNSLGNRGALTFNQLEEVNSRGFYMQNEFSLLDNLELTFGLRYDEVDFDVTDRFLLNTTGDDSGSSSFDAVSPRVGLLWTPIQPLNLYFNYSTAFETPTTTEFANPGGGGFNPALTNQEADSFEIGAKGFVPSTMPITYDFTLFYADVSDEIVQTSNVGGRSFFSNAGSSTRKGVEAALSIEPIAGLVASMAYTFIDARFDTFRTQVPAANFDDNRLPGVPENQFFGELRYQHTNGLYTSIDVLFVDSIYATNANDVKVDAYTVSDLQFGWVKTFGSLEFNPFVGINNVFDETYNSNIRLNENFQRFFEPAPDRNAFAGFTVRYNY